MPTIASTSGTGSLGSVKRSIASASGCGRARELQHRGRRVGREHAVPGVDEVAGEQSAPAPEFEHEPIALAHRCEQLEDAGGAQIGVEAVPEVVHEGEVGAVVGLVHGAASSSARATADGASGASTTSSSAQVPMPTTGTPVRSANAISDSVP